MSHSYFHGFEPQRLLQRWILWAAKALCWSVESLFFSHTSLCEVGFAGLWAGAEGEKLNLLEQQQSPSGWRGCSLAVLMSLCPERDRSGSGESSYSGTRTPASAVDSRTARDIPPLPAASHCSQLQSGTMTSEESFRANAVSTPTLGLWKGHSSCTCLGAALLPWTRTRNLSNRCWKRPLAAWSFGTPGFFCFFFFLQEEAMWKTT